MVEDEDEKMGYDDVGGEDREAADRDATMDDDNAETTHRRTRQQTQIKQ